MQWLNYHHLLYFWVVAREGGLVRAAQVLRLTHPTLSTQLRALEARLGEPLFSRTGRKLQLTATGRVVFRYADEIFGLGRELLEAVQGRASGHPPRIDIGITDAVPKTVVQRLLQPAFALSGGVRLVCHENAHDRLLADLAVHALDLVIADAPVPPSSPVRVYHHLLGETGVTFFGVRALARSLRSRFPASLDQAPMLLPLEHLTLRRELDQWFARHGVRPRLVAEFEDSALLKVVGGEGRGCFVAPTVVEDSVVRQYGVEVIGRTQEVRERFYAITAERRVRNPAVVAITEAARTNVFGEPAAGRGSRRARTPVPAGEPRAGARAGARRHGGT